MSSQKKFITCIRYGGFDIHDASLKSHQVMHNGEYAIPIEDVEISICNDIIKQFPCADRDHIMRAVCMGKKYEFLVVDERNDDPVKHTVTVNGYQMLELYADGQISYETTYLVEKIEKDKICYVPEEQFYAYAKYMPLVERIYHEPFRNRKEAEKFMVGMKPHHKDSEIVMLVHNIDQVMESELYKVNMRIIKILRQHPELKNIFFVRADEHLRALQTALSD